MTNSPKNLSETATKSGSTGGTPSPTNQPLIAGKHFTSFTPEEFKEHVQSMYELRQKSASAKAKAPSYAEGLSLKRTKTGKVSITRNKKKRPLCYVTDPEITALAKGHGMSITEAWNAFKQKKYVIAKTQGEALKIIGDIKDIPW